SLGVRSTSIRCPLCPPDTVKHRSSDGTSGQSVITCKVVSKMSLVTSLLTTCEICE
ncbi:unnamed protein product, partial [Staurois parvus]